MPKDKIKDALVREDWQCKKPQGAMGNLKDDKHIAVSKLVGSISQVHN